MQDTEFVSPVAAHVIAKCGGYARTAQLVGRTTSWIYRWTYPKSRKGTGGRVPHGDAEILMDAALRGEVDLTPADFFSGYFGEPSTAAR